MKKIISITLCLLITFSLLSVNTFNAFAIKSGITGGCTWTLYGTELTISGTGAMGDYTYDTTLPWGTGITKVTIESGVTAIGTYAFHGCNKLTSIEIPDSVTSIGNYAFYCCNKLASIEIPDSVTSIGGGAFYGCNKLASVSIGNSVTSIDVSAFEGCASLASIVIPDSVTSIGWYAFYNCASLASIVIPDSVTSIDFGAFTGCTGLKDIYYLGTAEQWKRLTNKPQGTVHFCKPGDTNGDGEIDDKDINLIKRYLAGWDVEVVEAALDVNKDGSIDDKDVNYLARCLAGWSGYEL